MWSLGSLGYMPYSHCEYLLHAWLQAHIVVLHLLTPARNLNSQTADAPTTMQPQFVPPSMPGAGAPQDQVAVAAGLYSHAERKPMLIELGDAGHVRCTTIVRSAKTGQRRLCRTKWHGSYLTSEYANGMPNHARLDMVFSCKLNPSIQPVSTFDWNAELNCWRNKEVLMYTPPPCMW